MRVAEELGIDAEVIVYQKTPPDREALEWLVAHIEDPPTDLVRRDSLFKKLGLTDADVAHPDQIVALLLERKMLLQRPIVIRGERAIVGRPKERVRQLLSG